jgi:hypothetical protein
MNHELQQYYENQFTLFIQPGWTDLVEDLQRLKDSINDLSLVTDTQDLYFRKGQLDIFTANNLIALDYPRTRMGRKG